MTPSLKQSIRFVQVLKVLINDCEDLGGGHVYISSD